MRCRFDSDFFIKQSETTVVHAAIQGSQRFSSLFRDEDERRQTFGGSTVDHLPWMNQTLHDVLQLQLFSKDLWICNLLAPFERMPSSQKPQSLTELLGNQPCNYTVITAP